jgi:ribulose-5-phosphate 4-epimerase/fuculose-1-phosphate aldolase
MFIQLPDGVPIIPFETPGSEALAEKIQKKIANCDAVILENHGIVTIGSTIEAAYNLNLMVEEAAKIQFLVMSLEGKTEMNLASLKKNRIS